MKRDRSPNSSAKTTPGVISRIAPTPSGYLHAGNALSFLLTWLLVRSQGGHLHLRIDDLDAPRLKKSCLDDIFRQLEWLGLDYDSGPSGVEDLSASHSQVFRISKYETMLEKLRGNGQLYACTCSRKQVREVSGNGVYPGTCRNQKKAFNPGQAVWRVRLPRPCVISIEEPGSLEGRVGLSAEMGDFIVCRKDGLPAYQIASLADDLELGTNLVVRGEDLIPSTAAQCFLAHCLGESMFPNARFLHHPLLKNPDGKKLSKTGDAFSLRELREVHQTPGLLYRMTAEWLGIPTMNITSLDELLSAFRNRSLATPSISANQPMLFHDVQPLINSSKNG